MSATCSCYEAGRDPMCPVHGSTAGDIRSESETRVPVMVRGGKVHAPSKYRVHGEYETFDEAATVVHALRQTPGIAWAYIPDEYAPAALSPFPPTPEQENDSE